MEKQSDRKLSGMAGRISGLLQRVAQPKTVAAVLTVCYVCSLIPLCVLAWFNHASADDYTNGSGGYHVWSAGHSVVAVLGAAFQKAVYEWHTWRGCFTSAFLSAVPPHIFGAGGYRVTTWLVLGLLTASVLYFMYMLFVRLFRADVWTVCSIGMLTLLLSVQCAPGGVELFYWYSGAINYTFMYGVSLLFYGALLSAVVNQGRRRRTAIVAASVLGFLVGGANQMTMLNAAICLTAAVCLLLCLKKRAVLRTLGIPVGIFYAAALLSIVAPGNYVRAEQAGGGMRPLKAVLVSLYNGLDMAVNDWLTWPLIVAVIVMIPLFWHIFASTRFSFPYPFWALLFGYGVVSAMFTPPLFAVGNVEAGRIQGTAYLMFVLALVLCTGYLTGWLRKKYERIADKAALPAEKREAYGKETCLCLTGALAFMAFGILMTVIPEPRAFNSVSAAADLVNGSAGAYADALHTREEKYRESAGEDVQVAALPAKPELLYFSDITPDPEDWQNRGVARFYDLGSVAVVTDGTTIR